VTVLEIATPHGCARVYLHEIDDAQAMLVLGHGAGGGLEAPDLMAARDAALSVQIGVALVEQPYRVAGRRSPAPASQLDAAWTAAVEGLRSDRRHQPPLIVGGRSLGARVACRTAAGVGAAAVLCLAFPLEPPTRGGKPRQSRLPELDAVTLPVLVVQGDRDSFGIPPPGPSRDVITVHGDHSLRADTAGVREAVRAWLTKVAA
jgi:predicted alpha/beta-hydrolase family hydrolase